MTISQNLGAVQESNSTATMIPHGTALAVIPHSIARDPIWIATSSHPIDGGLAPPDTSFHMI
jgi:hypothetical protein